MPIGSNPTKAAACRFAARLRGQAEAYPIDGALFLVSKRIPHSYPKVVKIGPLRIVPIDQIRAAQQVYGEIHRKRHRGRMNPDARTGFYEVGPILALVVKRQIPVHIELRAKVPRPNGEADSRLRVDQ